jgi:glycine/D-amino acid oxidase-like deaminating enzyme
MQSTIVVGAGCFGASLAHRLAGEGWDVVLVERERPGHPESSSGGPSRLIRCAHGGDAWYTRSARRARELWLDLERESGRRLMLDVGVAWFAHEAGAFEDDAMRLLAEEGIPAEWLDPGDCGGLFPSFDGTGLERILWEPEAGVLLAASCVEALAEQAVARGARLVRGRAVPSAGTVRVGDRTLEADHVVWACGAWLGALFPDLVDLRVTRQEVAFFEAPAGWTSPPLPGFVDFAQSWYGCGAIADRGVKVASDADGPSTTADEPLGEISAAAERRARDYVTRRFPALAGTATARSGVCRYEATGDAEFIAAAHPEHPGVWLLGGGSGHGFKHGPALAEHVHSLLAGTAAPEPRLGLSRRGPRRALRTAPQG